jgi:hypothetical protein
MRRIALVSLVIAVSAGGAAGVIALVAGAPDETQARIVFSTFCVGVTGTLAFVSGRAWDRRKLMPLPPAALAASLVAGAATLVWIWGGTPSDTLGRACLSLFLLALAMTDACRLATAAPSPRGAWLRRAAYTTGAGLTILLLAMVWGPPVIREELWRTAAALAILVATLVLLVPVLGSLSKRGDIAGGCEPLHCPACGAGLPAP